MISLKPAARLTCALLLGALAATRTARSDSGPQAADARILIASVSSRSSLGLDGIWPWKSWADSAWTAAWCAANDGAVACSGPEAEIGLRLHRRLRRSGPYLGTFLSLAVPTQTLETPGAADAVASRTSLAAGGALRLGWLWELPYGFEAESGIALRDAFEFDASTSLQRSSGTPSTDNATRLGLGASDDPLARPSLSAEMGIGYSF